MLVRVMKGGVAAHVFLIAYDVWIAHSLEVGRPLLQFKRLLLFLTLSVGVSFDAFTLFRDRL